MPSVAHLKKNGEIVDVNVDQLKRRAVTVMVITCPHTLGLAIPLAAGILYGYGITEPCYGRSSNEPEYCYCSYKCKDFKDGMMFYKRAL